MGIISLASGSSCWRGLDIEHPRKSTCDCPLANGKRIICKHIVATYFTALPEEAINFEEEQERLQEEYEKEQEEEYDKAIEWLNKMSKQELINELIQVFDYGPEWIYNDFIKRNLY